MQHSENTAYSRFLLCFLCLVGGVRDRMARENAPMAFKRSAVRSRLSPPRDLEREFRVFFFFAARPTIPTFPRFWRVQRFARNRTGRISWNRWYAWNRDFVEIVEAWLRQAALTWKRNFIPNRYRIQVNAAARFALLSASHFPPPSQSADAPCDTVAAPCFCCAG